MAEVGRISAQTARKLRKALEPKKAQPIVSNGTCTVHRIDKDGTAWVTLPGATTQTPVNGVRTSEIKVGQTVAYNISNGRLSITGNASEPSVGATHVAETVAPVDRKADDAANAAASAQTSADEAANAASRADASANAAQASADAAQESADSAAGYASRALGNLSTVQSVAETLSWITQHGTMALTSDVAPDPTHVYFVADAQGDYTVGGGTYSVVAEPDADDMSSYYELSIDESLNNYVGTHLAVTDEGLWVIPAASGGYKILIATGSGTTYTTAGTYIIDSGGTTVAFFGASVTIGDTAYPHITITNTALTMYGLLNADVIDLDTLAQQYYNPLRRNDGTAFGLLAKIGKFNISDRGAYWEYELPNHAVRLPFVITDGVVRIGDEYTSNILMDGSSLKVIDGEGHTFFEVADLRGDDGLIDQTQWKILGHSPASTDWTLTLEGASQVYSLKDTRGNDLTYATTSVSSGIKVDFTTAEAASMITVVVSYRGPMATGESKAYTLGYRLSGSDVGVMSLAEGMDVTSSGFASHAEGYGSTASGICAHAEGGWMSGTLSAYGGTASGMASHAQNEGTVAASTAQTAMGKYNANDPDNALEVGNGTSDSNRSNALAVHWDGTLDLDSPLPIASGGTGVSSKQTDTPTLDTTNCTSVSDYNVCWHNGIVATVQLGMFKLNTALATGSSVVVGEVPYGYRPASRIYVPVSLASVTAPGHAYAYITNSGTITLVNRSGSSLSTSQGICITATYAI